METLHEAPNILVIGAAGAGKSALIRLLLGKYSIGESKDFFLHSGLMGHNNRWDYSIEPVLQKSEFFEPQTGEDHRVSAPERGEPGGVHRGPDQGGEAAPLPRDLRHPRHQTEHNQWWRLPAQQGERQSVIRCQTLTWISLRRGTFPWTS